MSKVGGALPSWYWPAGVPRRVAVPQQPLDRLLREKFGAIEDRPALLWDGGALSYGDLLERMLALAGGIQAAQLAGTIAIAEPDPVEEVTLLLGALCAGRSVLLTDPGTATEEAAAQLREAQASAILTSSGAGKLSAAAGLGAVASGDLRGAFREPPARRATEPAVLLPSGRGVVVHSHFSLSAMWASLAAFVIGLRQLPFICMEPIGSWEMLAGTVGAFMSGMPVRFATLDQLGAHPAAGAPATGYTVITRALADRMLSEGSAPRLLGEMPYLFVSTGHFKPHWRRRLEKSCGRPIFPLWGTPEVGPVVASHPTWFPLHGHGLPLVNVSIVPIDPASGQLSIVPWEMLERAEVGVEALSAMVGYAQPRATDARIGKIVRTRQIAAMDHVGVVTLFQSSGEAS